MDAMYRDLKQEIDTVLPDIFAKIKSRSASMKQRAERQARLWRIETFEKGNDQVLDQLERMSTSTITRRRNHLYQQYVSRDLQQLLLLLPPPPPRAPSVLPCCTQRVAGT